MSSFRISVIVMVHLNRLRAQVWHGSEKWIGVDEFSSGFIECILPLGISLACYLFPKKMSLLEAGCHSIETVYEALELLANLNPRE